MKIKKHASFFVTVSAAMLMASMVVLSAGAQSVPSLINYQGLLTGASGAAVTAGPYVIQFRLWNSPTANSSANLIWSEQQTLTVQTSGSFNVILGTGSTIASDSPAVASLISAFSSTNVYLGLTITSSNGVAISSPLEIVPRQQLLTGPYAVQAQFAVQAQVASLLVSNLQNALCPPGTVVAYMGTSAPVGWLICDGSLVSRTQYSALFAVLGAASGSGDGSTTFNLPDMRGMFLRGLNSSQSNPNYSDPDVSSRANEFSGGNVGNAVGSVQLDDYHKHSHGGYVSPNGTTGQTGVGSYLTVHGSTEVSPTTGGNETRPRNIYVNYIIKY